MSLHPYLDTTGPIALAHRGGAEEWPENTFEAFAGSYDIGLRYIETDVHLTSDGVIVAFHDPDLRRLGNIQGKIADTTWQQLSSIRVNGQGRIPSLEELLREFPDMRLNIDMKSNQVIGPLVDLIRNCDAFDRVCLASFHDQRIHMARALAGAELCVSAGRISVAKHVLRSYGVLPKSKSLSQPSNPDGHVKGYEILQVPLRRYGTKVFSKRFLAQALLEKKLVHVWTINEAAMMHELLDMGVAGIISDRPTLLKQVFIERGIWPI
jgi:glycerophosphoryl diester phosphodiesterase